MLNGTTLKRPTTFEDLSNKKVDPSGVDTRTLLNRSGADNGTLGFAHTYHGIGILKPGTVHHTQYFYPAEANEINGLQKAREIGIKMDLKRENYQLGAPFERKLTDQEIDTKELAHMEAGSNVLDLSSASAGQIFGLQQVPRIDKMKEEALFGSGEKVINASIDSGVKGAGVSKVDYVNSRQAAPVQPMDKDPYDALAK